MNRLKGTEMDKTTLNRQGGDLEKNKAIILCNYDQNQILRKISPLRRSSTLKLNQRPVPKVDQNVLRTKLM